MFRLSLTVSLIQHRDVELPLNLDQVQLLDMSPLVAKPLEQPTDSSLFSSFHAPITSETPH